MTLDDFKAAALEALRAADELDALDYMKAGARDGKRLLDAQGAWPDMSLPELWNIDRQRQSGGKNGRPKESVQLRAMQAIWLAARDVDRIKELWDRLNVGPTMPSELALEIAAARRNVSIQALADQIRRPASRRIDRLAARK